MGQTKKNVFLRLTIFLKVSIPKSPQNTTYLFLKLSRTFVLIQDLLQVGIKVWSFFSVFVNYGPFFEPLYGTVVNSAKTNCHIILAPLSDIQTRTIRLSELYSTWPLPVINKRSPGSESGKQVMVECLGRHT